MLLWRIVYKEVPEAIPAIIRDKSISKEQRVKSKLHCKFIFSKDTHQTTPSKDVTWKDAPQPKELLITAHKG